jgi:hypothetical protein
MTGARDARGGGSIDVALLREFLESALEVALTPAVIAALEERLQADPDCVAYLAAGRRGRGGAAPMPPALRAALRGLVLEELERASG